MRFLARAETSMRQVNEAWRVLGDQHRRTTYDHSLVGPVRAPRPGVQTSADGITRIDPRLLDPEFLAARRRSQVDTVEYKNSWMLRALPMVAFVVLLVGIIVFTAYPRTPGTSITTTTFRGPDIGIDPGACVRRLPEAGLLALPCDGNEDGGFVNALECFELGGFLLAELVAGLGELVAACLKQLDQPRRGERVFGCDKKGLDDRDQLHRRRGG